jgi:ubiquitin thioesterase protein OTUB1
VYLLPERDALTGRSGHYDILYKAEDFPAPVQHAQPIPQQPPLNVALANYASGDFVPMATNMTEAMNMIPGLYATGIGRGWPSIPYDYSPSAAPQPQAAPVPTYAPAPAPVVPMASIHQEYVSPIHVSHLNHHIPPSHHDIRLEPPVTLPIHPAPPMTIERGTGPFRPSVWELEPGLEMGRMSVPSLQTSIFRK